MYYIMDVKFTDKEIRDIKKEFEHVRKMFHSINKSLMKADKEKARELKEHLDGMSLILQDIKEAELAKKVSELSLPKSFNHKNKKGGNSSTRKQIHRKKNSLRHNSNRKTNRSRHL